MLYIIEKKIFFLCYIYMIYLKSSLKNFKNEKDVIEEKFQNLVLNNNYILDEFIDLIDKHTTIKINLITNLGITNLGITDNLIYKNHFDYISRKNIEKIFYKKNDNDIEKYIIITKIKNEYSKCEYRDEEYIKRFSIYSDIDLLYKQINFIYKVYKNNKIERVNLEDNFIEIFCLIHNDEYKYILLYIFIKLNLYNFHNDIHKI